MKTSKCFFSEARLSKAILRLACATLLLGWLNPAWAAMPISSLYNTGVDDTGVALGDSIDDPHYSIVAGPLGAVPDETVANDGFPIPPWLAINEGSRWISPVDPGNDANADPGTYVYETTFDLTGMDPQNAAISGWWSADDSGSAILLNDVAIPAAAGQGFSNSVWFGLNSASAEAAGATLLEGVNTLSFQIDNGGEAANPTGLRVDRTYGRGAPLGTVPIPGLFNTGVDDLGLPLADGLADPHYVMTVAPDGTPQPATAIASPPSPPWIQLTGSSRWIAPNDPGGVADPGPYAFETTFDLTGLDPSSAVITGLWSVDNAGSEILLNGEPTGNAQVGSFVDLTPFQISATEGDAFLAGLNTLTFVLDNLPPDPNPIGLRVEAMVAHAVPEPSSMALLLLGGLLFWRRRR